MLPVHNVTKLTNCTRFQLQP